MKFQLINSDIVAELENATLVRRVGYLLSDAIEFEPPFMVALRTLEVDGVDLFELHVSHETAEIKLDKENPSNFVGVWTVGPLPFREAVAAFPNFFHQMN